MKPRIFVSSTFYDLKYIRDDLSNFIKAHDFEPIMFEEGDIGYTPGKQLDESCYEAMRNADMVVLIIGGNYGSPASGEKEDDFEEYLSITRKEYKTASEEGIPIFIFVDAAVYSEYNVYEANIELIENHKHKINFCATKNINIFRFIKEIRAMGSLSITEFRKPGEIKAFLGKQWADMFKNYLKSLREEKNAEQIHEALDNMSILIKQMEIMVNGLGKKVINNDENVEFDKLLNQQMYVKAEEIAKKIARSVACSFEDGREKKKNIKLLLDTLCDFLEKTGVDETSLTKELFRDLSDMMNDKGIELHRLGSMIFSDECLKVVCNNSDIKAEVEKRLCSEFYYSRISR
jgi:hypothetical protein